MSTGFRFCSHLSDPADLAVTEKQIDRLIAATSGNGRLDIVDMDKDTCVAGVVRSPVGILTGTGVTDLATSGYFPQVFKSRKRRPGRPSRHNTVDH